MNNHYIPKLLLRQFSDGKRINTYDFLKDSFQTKKLQHTFSEKNLFDPELENAFAVKLEGPIGDILNNRLIKGDQITLNRKENLLLRKFLMINFLRAPIVNTTWEEMVKRTSLKDHPSVKLQALLREISPEFRKLIAEGMPSSKTYIRDLKLAMEYDSILDMAEPEKEDIIPMTLQMTARLSMVTCIAFWDCEKSGQEFILPKLPGISMMDQRSLMYKWSVIREKKEEMKRTGLDKEQEKELNRLEMGSIIDPENFAIYPISPTRVLIKFSPYFRAFFPIMDFTDRIELCPSFLEKEQFSKHFFEPMRMELFKPCRNAHNQMYQYDVRTISSDEVLALNSLLLDMETEEFAFHDFNKIRDSFWYYDHKARFVTKKKHDFSHMI